MTTISTSQLSQIVEFVSSSATIAERRRLGREIHDTLIQEFAGILLHLEAGGESVEAGRRIPHECLAHAKELAKNGLEDARRMLLGLRPKTLEGTNLPDALERLAERFSRDCGIACSFACRQKHDIPDEIQDALYRVAQEGLANVRKHSGATSAWLSLSCGSGEIVFTIRDNGKGFSPRPATGGGCGLETMRERVEHLGGEIDLATLPGAGASLSIVIPLRRPKAREALYR